MGSTVNKAISVGTLGLVDDVTGTKAAADASKKAAATQAQYQNRALDYMMQKEEMPTHYRDQAMTDLGMLYGIAPERQEYIPEFTPEQQAVIEEYERMQVYKDSKFGRKFGGAMAPAQQQRMTELQEQIAGFTPLNTQLDPQQEMEQYQQQFFTGLESSPIYEAIMGGQKAGEESIARNAAMTGGLRSGNLQHNFMDYNTQLKNKAMMTAYQDKLSGLQGFAQLPSNANNIATQMSGIGQTLAQGRMGGAQAQQDMNQAIISGLFNAGGKAAGAMAGGA